MATVTLAQPAQSELQTAPQIQTLLDDQQDIETITAVDSLRVLTNWNHFKAYIYPIEAYKSDKPSNKPVYAVDFNCFKPHLVFYDGPSTKSPDAIFATGTLNYVSINAHCKIGGRDTRIQALKRWRTRYEYLSHAFVDASSGKRDGTPLVPMIWTSNCSLKSWTFVCSDQHGNAVARFRAHCWSFSQVGVFEFLGPWATDKAAREEIVVTGLTLFYCMVMRTNSLLSFAGAVFARPGHQNLA